MQNFEKTYMQMLFGIELCIKQKLQFPTLTLIYSVIDSLAYIAYGDKQVGDNFKKWVNEYMNVEKELNVTAIDLYSARNAIIHTLTPNSRDTKSKIASVIAYVWGDADLNMANKSIEISQYKNLKFIHINDLHKSLRHGIIEFLESNLSNEVNDRMNEQFSSLSKEILEDFVNFKK